jgi:hypothetical protein
MSGWAQLLVMMKVCRKFDRNSFYTHSFDWWWMVSCTGVKLSICVLCSPKSKKKGWEQQKRSWVSQLSSPACGNLSDWVSPTSSPVCVWKAAASHMQRFPHSPHTVRQYVDTYLGSRLNRSFPTMWTPSLCTPEPFAEKRHEVVRCWISHENTVAWFTGCVLWW